jgi:hypothetical protein
MNDTAALATDPHRLARAFLALTDDDALAPLPHSAARWIVALGATLVLAFAVPATWLAPPVHTLGKLGGQPSATLGSSFKAGLPPADDDEGAPH